MLTARANAALVLLAFALVLALPPKTGRPVAISVEGLRYLRQHHLHPHHHHQPPLMEALLSIPPARRMSATRNLCNSLVVNASMMLTARANAALVLPAFALALVLPHKM